MNIIGKTDDGRFIAQVDSMEIAASGELCRVRNELAHILKSLETNDGAPAAPAGPRRKVSRKVPPVAATVRDGKMTCKDLVLQILKDRGPSTRQDIIRELKARGLKSKNPDGALSFVTTAHKLCFSKVKKPGEPVKYDLSGSQRPDPAPRMSHEERLKLLKKADERLQAKGA